MAAPGPDKKLCGAQRANQPKGVTCGRVAGHGTDHKGVGRCSRHGGNTKNHKVAAEIELARIECDKLGVAIDVDPAAALLREVCETAGNVEFYRGLVQALPTHPDPDVYHLTNDGGYWERGQTGVYGRTYHVSGTPTGEAKPHILVQLYNDERKHLLAVTTAALKVGLAERQVKLAEQQGALIAQVLKGVLTDLGVADRPDVPGIVRKHLTLVSAG